MPHSELGEAMNREAFRFFPFLDSTHASAQIFGNGLPRVQPDLYDEPGAGLKWLRHGPHSSPGGAKTRKMRLRIELRANGQETHAFIDA